MTLVSYDKKIGIGPVGGVGTASREPEYLVFLQKSVARYRWHVVTSYGRRVLITAACARMPPDRGKALGSAAVAVGPEVSYDEIRRRLMVGLRWKIDITAANATAASIAFSVA